MDNWRIQAAADRMTAMMYTGGSFASEPLDEELYWFVQEWPRFVEACGDAVCAGWAGALSSRVIGIAEHVTKVFAPQIWRERHWQERYSAWDFYRAMTKEEGRKLVAEDAAFEEGDALAAQWTTRRASFKG